MKYQPRDINSLEQRASTERHIALPGDVDLAGQRVVGRMELAQLVAYVTRTAEKAFRTP